MAHIKYYGDLKRLTGKDEDEIAAKSLSDVLSAIGSQYGKPAKKAAKASLIVVDDEKVLSIRKAVVKEDSKIGFFPTCCGG